MPDRLPRPVPLGTLRERAEQARASLPVPGTSAEVIERICYACIIDGYDAGFADGQAAATGGGLMADVTCAQLAKER
jgi:hypothetical protein